MKQKQYIRIVLVFVFFLLSAAQAKEIYKDDSYSIEDRLEDLLCRMTLSEKIAQISGTGFMNTRPNERLGIPIFRMSDGPLGPNGKGRATNFSSAINMAASWDTELMSRIATAIAEESKALGFNLLLSPNGKSYQGTSMGTNL